MTADLTDVATHFRFGLNWSDFANSVSEERVRLATRCLGTLLPAAMLTGCNVLDIGSGSGLSAVAALRLGARHVTAIDIDSDSVATSRAVLQRFAQADTFETCQESVFDLARDGAGRFDIVHSWGVLHHTGDLTRAIDAAAAQVKPDGLLCLALYRRTPIDEYWVVEKRIYSRAPAWMQTCMATPFKAAYLAGLVATGRNPIRYLRDYREARGMSWSHDVNDWLGGYPYESIEKDELVSHLQTQGFALEYDTDRPVRMKGLFGAPCNEYRFRKSALQV